MTKIDRLGLTLARRMRGVVLSADEIDQLYAADNRGAPPLTDADCVPDMDAVLAALLDALGITIPRIQANRQLDFKQALVQACLIKIRQLTGKGNNKGSGAVGNQQQTNPLIPGGAGGELEPIYMSLQKMHHQNAAMRDSLARMPATRELTEAEIETLSNGLARRMGCII